jgi:hypothetical protein
MTRTGVGTEHTFSELGECILDREKTNTTFAATGGIMLRYQSGGAKVMNLFEIEIGRKYKCDRNDGQYFATVREKRDGRIGVILGNKVRGDGDPADPIDRLGTLELVWVEPGCIHSM